MPYAPTSMTTAAAGVQGFDRIFYVRKALDRLQKKFLFRKPCDPEDIPLHNGRTAQWYRWNNMTSDTAPAVEGTVGNGLTINMQVLTATVSQFVNFISISDMQVQTYPEALIAAASELLGYRAGITVDTITRLVIDNEFASVSQTPQATYLRATDLAQTRHQLQALDVQGWENDNRFLAIVHPYCSYDLANDPNVLGYYDRNKYTDGARAVDSAPDRGLFVQTAHCNVWESTNVRQVGSNYYNYIFGKGAVGCLDLAGNGPSKVTDPRNEKFRINVIRPNGPSIPDPAGQIGAAVSYNFKTTTVVKEGPAPIGGTYRYRIISAPTSLV